MRALLLGNGESPPSELIKREAATADLIICADGAASWAIGEGIRPDLIVGDLDSLDATVLHQLRREGIHVEQFPPEKDDTDMQLAAEYALNKGVTSIVMLGATGRRLDHALGNLQVLAFLHLKGVDAHIVDEYCDTTIYKDERRIIDGIPGGLFSLVPLGGDVYVRELSGVKYPLSDFHLAQTRPLGISNVFVKEKTVLDVSGAVAFIVVSKS